MSHSMSRTGFTIIFGFAAMALMSPAELNAQTVAFNPYHAQYDWAKMPEGTRIGVASGVFPDPDGRHIWVLSRCGANHCALVPDVDPILKFDLDGNLGVQLRRRHQRHRGDTEDDREPGPAH